MNHFLPRLYCAHILKRSTLEPELTGCRVSRTRIGGSFFTPWSKAEDFAGMGVPVRGAGCCPMGDRSTGPLAKIRVGAPVA